ncbi:MAG: ABC transporter ATP-binding protein [Treponema sp.]|nr:ABC transporter ATP-binding protein [Treponema sp.]
MNNLVLKNFSFEYSKNKKVLSDISFSLEPGDFVCLCGPNGAGKSTLLHALADSAEIKNVKERAKKISFLTQNENALWDYTVFDTVLSGRFCYTGKLGNYTREDFKIAEKVIKNFGLEALSEKSVHQISGGEFQKVRLARSFAQGSGFLLLDEPLSSLDFVASESLMNLLKEKCFEQNKAVLVSIHDINMAARFADKVLLLGKCQNEKQLCFQGSVQDVLTSENLSAVYNTKVKTFFHPELKIPQI